MRDYSKTVNLPKTSFPMKAELAKKEPEILSRWSSGNLYHKMVERRKQAPAFILHDGPPYANGHVHLGTALNKILKDIIVKYKSLAGFYSPYVPGWDCHGLPIEFQVLKNKGLKKKDIDQLRLRKDAHAFAERFIDIQRQEFQRLGVLGDWDHPYLTMEKGYVAAQLRAFKGLVEKKDLVYRGLKPVYWCATCETALADAEVEYADKESDSVTVAFPLIDQPGTFVAVWTTTPWTLPANVALAFNPAAKYVTLKTSKGGQFVVAEARQEALAKILKAETMQGPGKSGQEFEGLLAKHPFLDRASRLVTADYVSLEDGTGVVHIAPGHGLEDYAVGLKHKLPVLSPVDDEGRFTQEMPAYQGHNVFEANTLIIKDLEKKGTLLHHQKITHSYPHCWRCKNPVIFRATEQWFLAMEETPESPALRPELLAAIDQVRWTPDYGINRIRGMVQNRPDWCLSRQRYWGVPIPVFYCENCQEPLVEPRTIERVASLVEKEGTEIWFQKSAQELLPEGLSCSRCQSQKFRKEESILDVWFDSGVSHESVMPHLKGQWHPAEMYLEGSDQHRGWFQTSLITSVALHNQAPYKEVLTHGFVVDGQGRKMSKSLGNVISPEEIIKKYGAEILRLWVATSDYKDDIRISQEILDRTIESYRKIRNTLRFLLGNLSDFDPSKTKGPVPLWPLDTWALSQLQNLNSVLRQHYQDYEFHLVVARLNEFCSVEMSEFYFDILKDRLYTLAPDSPGRRSAQQVLWEILLHLIKLVAPILSFTAQEAWDMLKQDHPSLNLSESPFLEDWTSDDQAFQENEDFKHLRTWRQKVNEKLEAARQQGLLGKSLEAKVRITTAHPEDFRRLQAFQINDQLAAILIVSQVEVVQGTSEQIQVQHADGQKCARCWRWTKEVGQVHPELCARCVEALGSLQVS